MKKIFHLEDYLKFVFIFLGSHELKEAIIFLKRLGLEISKAKTYQVKQVREALEKLKESKSE